MEARKQVISCGQMSLSDGQKIALQADEDGCCVRGTNQTTNKS
jgi:hypothetical protein